MSIPPLVCSTPPPPDQCDDDKEHDDFDINYSLSQVEDDEDNQYDFFNSVKSGSVGTYDGTREISLPPEAKSSFTSQTLHERANNPEIKNEYLLDTHHQGNINTEDNNIEDLDLQLEEISIISTSRNTPENSIKADLEKDSVITEVSPSASGNETTESSPSISSGIGITLSEIDVTCDSNLDGDLVDKNCHPQGDATNAVITNEPILNEMKDIEVSQVDKDDTFNEDTFQCNKSEVVSNLDPTISTNIKDSFIDDLKVREEVDDFGDFDTFQTANAEPNSSCHTSNACHDVNPWENAEALEEFEEFNANFDTIRGSQLGNIPSSLVEQSVYGEAEHVNEGSDIDNDADDFGDFDDFKASGSDPGQLYREECLTSDVHVFDLQTSDSESQYLENITKVFNSVFEEEVIESDMKFEKMLEFSLSEVWRHLLETETRQPYMVTWNNSLGQKTLLRSLCIDSRNILFGPKWNSNTPRYASNLVGVPLQPQKQVVMTNAPQTDSVNSDKQTHSSHSWTDSFTSSDQESGNTESGAEPVKTRLPRPEDIENAEKKYPNSLNIPPLCQISLPDTHIFTPTDSETPRSKTIHYDNGTSILSPQVSKEKDILKLGSSSLQQAHMTDDYEDFQDFKAASVGEASNVTPAFPPANLESTISNITPNVIYQTQAILQPTKIVPMMPTLNWPDPGQVPMTFEDFSDFTTNSSWFDAKKELNESVENTKTISSQCDSELKVPVQEKQIVEADVSDAKANDDDFDNFQCAIPKQSPLNNSSFEPINCKKLDDPFKFILPEVQSSFNTENINSLPITKIPANSKRNDVMLNNHQSLGSSDSTSLSHSGGFTTRASSHVLQPIQTTSTHNSAQILQPLSLESISQINWPNPGIDLQDLSRFNPVEKVHYLHNEASGSGASPAVNNTNQSENDDGWGDFVSIKTKQQNNTPTKQVPVEDDEWSDFVSSPSVRTQNGLNTISLNVHSNIKLQKNINKNFKQENKQIEIPSLNYVTPKTTSFRAHNRVSNQHFQNL